MLVLLGSSWCQNRAYAKNLKMMIYFPITLLCYFYKVEFNFISRKKEGAPTLHDSMDGSGEYMLSETSQVVREKYHMIPPISGM